MKKLVLSLGMVCLVVTTTLSTPTVRVTNNTDCYQYVVPMVSVSSACLLSVLSLPAEIRAIPPVDVNYYDFNTSNFPFPYNTGLFYVVGFTVYDGLSMTNFLGQVRAVATCSYLPDNDWPLQECDATGVMIEYVGTGNVEMYLD